MTEKITVSEILKQMKENWHEAAVPETGVMLGLIRLNDIVVESTTRAIAEYGLTQAAFEVLVTLRSLPEPQQLTPTDLYRFILITSGGMTKVLKQLEMHGLIERLINKDDQRSKFVRLTEAGGICAERSMEAVSKNDKKILSQALSPSQISQLGNILLHALNNLESE
ncbi:MAG: MarR family transcriptional regulator [Magnetovibrio sp.]|nr:MarR family transcriptional regulator [Magnetovibrio sp.]